jgi:thymidine kinase
MSGYLEITFGPMFSGKTTALIDKVNRFMATRKQQGKRAKVLIINYSGDTRETQTKDGLTPHDHKCINDGDKTVIRARHIGDIDVNEYDYIAIDESQFFVDLVGTVLLWVGIGKHVHCSGLIADSERCIFGSMIKLMPRADNVEQLKAFCSVCGDKILNAPFTKPICSKREQVRIGGKDEYMAVCGKHY